MSQWHPTWFQRKEGGIKIKHENQIKKHIQDCPDAHLLFFPCVPETKTTDVLIQYHNARSIWLLHLWQPPGSRHGVVLFTSGRRLLLLQSRPLRQRFRLINKAVWAFILATLNFHFMSHCLRFFCSFFYYIFPFSRASINANDLFKSDVSALKARMAALSESCGMLKESHYLILCRRTTFLSSPQRKVCASFCAFLFLKIARDMKTGFKLETNGVTHLGSAETTCFLCKWFNVILKMFWWKIVHWCMFLLPLIIVTWMH